MREEPVLRDRKIEPAVVSQESATVRLNAENSGGQALRTITPLEGTRRDNIYKLDGFKPVMIDRDFLKSIGISSGIDDAALQRLIEGSRQFQILYDKQTLTPDLSFAVSSANLNDPLEVHNYTGMCPTYVQELTPSAGACAIACQYCLVTDGDHRTPTVVWGNYPELVGKVLKEKKDISSFYYFSPKTEAFSEPHLETGIAHGILQAFIDHFERHPESKARMFIATKSGQKHLDYEFEEKSILDLLTQLKGRVQVNGSIGIMPQHLRDVLEPNAASIQDRLKALQMCQERGIYAESVLAQPLLIPYMTDEVIEDYCTQLQQAGIKNIKPEFLTADPMNVAYIAQFVHHFNPELMREFLEMYIDTSNSAHRKQRLRLAPDKSSSVATLQRLRKAARKHDMTISICNWVKQELGALDPSIKSIDAESSANGFRCLGYQKKLLT